MNENFPKRKPTRLKNFNYSSTGAYFITICTHDRKPILSDIVKPVGDGALDVPIVQLTQIGKIVERNLLSSENISNVKIDSYIIMPDHIHIIVFINKNTPSQNGTSKAPSPTNETLPHIVSTFKRFCTKDIGYNIFQRSFAEHIIRDIDDYKTRKKYLYENPIRWFYNNK